MTDSYATPHNEDGSRIMITNHGDHPPEFWAQITAEHIAPIAPSVTGKRRFAALALQAKIAEAIEPHHARVQSEADEINPEPYLDEAIAHIAEAAKGTEWEKHFLDPETQALIRQEIGRHFSTIQYNAIEWAKKEAN